MDDPIVENPKIFWKNFFILGVGGKKPPPLEIEGILGKVFWGSRKF